jgi:hypothetical protein
MIKLISSFFFVCREDGKGSMVCREEGKRINGRSDFIEAGILNRTKEIYPLVCICERKENSYGLW